MAKLKTQHAQFVLRDPLWDIEKWFFVQMATTGGENILLDFCLACFGTADTWKPIEGVQATLEELQQSPIFAFCDEVAQVLTKKIKKEEDNMFEKRRTSFLSNKIQMKQKQKT